MKEVIIPLHSIPSRRLTPAQIGEADPKGTINAFAGQHFASDASKTVHGTPTAHDHAQQAASLSRIAAGVDVLTARVTVDGEVLIVHADHVGNALLALHGTPRPGLQVSAKVEYHAMSSEEFAALPDWQ